MRLPLVGLLLALSTLLAVPACAQQDPEHRLAWVETTDPVKMFADSSRLGRLHFLTVCGIDCFEPEVGFLTYTHCYARAATTVTVDPTGDVVRSERHSQLKGKVREFASRYNILVREELDRTGRRHCPATERWDDYWNALESLVQQIPARPYKSFVTAMGLGALDRADFQLHVQDERDLAREIYVRACSLAPTFGIVGRVRFAVTTGNINDRPKQHPAFVCNRGRLAG